MMPCWWPLAAWWLSGGIAAASWSYYHARQRYESPRIYAAIDALWVGSASGILGPFALVIVIIFALMEWWDDSPPMEDVAESGR